MPSIPPVGRGSSLRVQGPEGMRIPTPRRIPKSCPSPPWRVKDKLAVLWRP